MTEVPTQIRDFQLNEKTKRCIARAVGLEFDEIRARSADSITHHIENKIGHKLRPGYSVGNSLIGRGSAYLFFRRLFGSCR